MTLFGVAKLLHIWTSGCILLKWERILGGAVKIECEDMSAQELRQRAGRVKDVRVSRRLLAIALVLEGTSRKVAAESCGIDRQRLRD